MFYSADEPCPLVHNPLKAIIAPRPIGWLTTVDENGAVNLAPYSFFNAVNSEPGILMFSSEGLKDSARNAAASGEFVFSLSTAQLQQPMNATSEAVAAGVDEYELAGLEKAACVHVKAPRVAASPASFECKTLHCQTLTALDGTPIDTHVVYGQIVGVHIDDNYLTEAGLFDTVKAQPLARCGYRDFTTVTSVFELTRPDD